MVNMLVELNRSQIITLLTSIYPPYEWIDELQHRKMGRYVGVTINGSKSENYQADYKVHSLDGQEPQFYFKSVAEHHIIEE